MATPPGSSQRTGGRPQRASNSGQQGAGRQHSHIRRFANSPIRFIALPPYRLPAFPLARPIPGPFGYTTMFTNLPGT